MPHPVQSLCLAVALAGLPFLTTVAADPSYSIPSQNGFNHDFGAHAPGDVLGLNVVPDSGVTNLTGHVDNGSSAGWAGGPSFTCTIPANFTGAHLGKFSGTYSKGGGQEGGQPPTWAGGAKSTIVKLTNTAVATTPTDRKRLTIGVGEEVDITTDPATSVTWSVSGGGTVSPASGTSTRLTAPGAKATSVVTATLTGGGTVTVSFDVIIPSDVAMTAAAPYYHAKGVASAGFTATPIVLQPTTVSFYRVKVHEGTATGTGTDVFSSENGLQHPNGGAVSTNQDNTINGQDTVRTYSHVANPPKLSGTFTWPIPWYYLLVSENGNGTKFTTLTHEAVADAAGSTTQSKGGASKAFALNDANAP